jgi:hypothetical protein
MDFVIFKIFFVDLQKLAQGNHKGTSLFLASIITHSDGKCNIVLICAARKKNSPWLFLYTTKGYFCSGLGSIIFPDPRFRIAIPQHFRCVFRFLFGVMFLRGTAFDGAAVSALGRGVFLAHFAIYLRFVGSHLAGSRVWLISPRVRRSHQPFLAVLLGPYAVG